MKRYWEDSGIEKTEHELRGVECPALEELSLRCIKLVEPLARHLDVDISSVEETFESAKRYAGKRPWDDVSFIEYTVRKIRLCGTPHRYGKRKKGDFR